jgi:uracil-DNA glycosylase family 4
MRTASASRSSAPPARCSTTCCTLPASAASKSILRISLSADIPATGGCASQNLLGSTQTIGKLRGRFHDYEGIPVLCTYHPAFLLPGRSPEKKRDVWEDMKLLLRRMGKPTP